MGNPLISAGEVQWISSGIAFNCRNDGRGREDYRQLEVQLGVLAQATGSARVRLGETDVIVGVKVRRTARGGPSRAQNLPVNTAHCCRCHCCCLLAAFVSQCCSPLSLSPCSRSLLPSPSSFPLRSSACPPATSHSAHHPYCRLPGSTARWLACWLRIHHTHFPTPKTTG